MGDRYSFSSKKKLNLTNCVNELFSFDFTPEEQFKPQFFTSITCCVNYFYVQLSLMVGVYLVCVKLQDKPTISYIIA